MSHAAIRHDDGTHLKESAVAAKDAVVDLATEAGRFANHRLGEAKQGAREIVGSMTSKAGEYNESFLGIVRRNPYQSLAIAAGIGLAAGYLLRRR